MGSLYDDLGRQLSLNDMAAVILNPSQESQFKIRGVTPLNRLESLYGRQRQAVRDKQRERYQQVLDGAGEKTTSSAGALSEVQEQCEAWLTAMRQGTLSPEEVQRNIAQAVTEIKRVNTVIESVERDAEAATAMIDTDPEDYEQTLLERFPTLAKSLPVVTDAWLKGEPDALDPLAGDG